MCVLLWTCVNSKWKLDRHWFRVRGVLVQDEIYDMVKPKDGIHITLQDLVKSGVGHTVAHMLTDVNGFWKYDNRESLMHEEDDEEE